MVLYGLDRDIDVMVCVVQALLSILHPSGCSPHQVLHGLAVNRSNALRGLQIEAKAKELALLQYRCVPQLASSVSKLPVCGDFLRAFWSSSSDVCGVKCG